MSTAKEQAIAHEIVEGFKEQKTDALEWLRYKIMGALLIYGETEIRKILQMGVDMRIAQRAYFKDRTRENLIASKEAESKFDKAASEL